jgi:hypothetical protein
MLTWLVEQEIWTSNAEMTWIWMINGSVNGWNRARDNFPNRGNSLLYKSNSDLYWSKPIIDNVPERWHIRAENEIDQSWLQRMDLERYPNIVLATISYFP